MGLPSYLESNLFQLPQFQLHVQRDNVDREEKWYFYTTDGIVYQFVLPTKNSLPVLLDSDGELLGEVRKANWCGPKKYELVFGEEKVKLSEKSFSFNCHRLTFAYQSDSWTLGWSPTLDPFKMEVTWSLTLDKELVAKYIGNFEPTCHMGFIEFQGTSERMQKLGPTLPRAIVLSLGQIAHRQKNMTPI